MQPVVEGNGVGKKRGIGVGGFLLALVTVGALTHVAVRMKGIEVAYALGRERRIATDLEEQRRRLQIEIGMLKDPGRVVTLARDKLKMAPPEASDIVRVAPGVLQSRPAPAPDRPERLTSGRADRVANVPAVASTTPPVRGSRAKPGKSAAGATSAPATIEPAAATAPPADDDGPGPAPFGDSGEIE